MDNKSSNKNDIKWEYGFKQYIEYIKTYKNSIIPSNYKTKKGFKLGSWLTEQRHKYNKGTLSRDRIKRLTKVGMVWNIVDYIWNENYKRLKDFFNEHKTIYPINKLPIVDGYNLYSWVSKQLVDFRKKKKTFTEKRKNLLEKVGLQFTDDIFERWNNFYTEAQYYYKKNGNLNVAYNYTCKNGYRLGEWLGRQRIKHKKGLLSKEKIRLLEKISMIWDVYDNFWDVSYKELCKYLKNGGSLLPIESLPVYNGINLCIWARTQIDNYRRKRNKLNDEQINKLEKIGFRWNLQKDNWDKMYNALTDYISINKVNKPFLICDIKDSKLVRWIKGQRKIYFSDNLNAEKIQKLETIGLIWNEFDYYWNEKYKIAKTIYEKNGNLDVTLKGNGKEIFYWIRKQRNDRKKGILDESKILLLDKIGMIWDASNKIIHSSFPEKAIMFYLSKVYKKVLSNDKITLNGVELDIYIPKINTAIEYDGVYFHKDRLKKDINKCLLCKNYNIRLIRFREYGLPKINIKYCETILVNGDDINELEKSIIKLFDMLNIKSRVKVNIVKDSVNISSLVNDYNSRFEIVYKDLEKYYSIYHNINIPPDYMSSSGVNLNKWLQAKRRAFYSKSGNISKEQIEKLNKLGMVWNPFNESWNNYYNLACDYYKTNHNLLINRGFIMNGYKLGNWIHSQRNSFRNKKISNERIELLNKIGMVWFVNKE